MDTSSHILGIDIAKLKFDVALIVKDKFKSKVFPNTHEGFVLLSQWLSQYGVQQLHACMEATGVYWRGLAEYLADAGYRVSVVNPVQIAAYAKSTLQRGKTDIQDARLIARFCERESPEIWHPEPVEQRQLLLLVRQLQHVNDCLSAERNRIQTAAPVVQSSIQFIIDCLEKESRALEERIKDHIDQNPTLKRNQQLLDSIPGIGSKTIPWLLAYLGDGQRFMRGKQAAAFAGLSPHPFQSGSSVRGKSRISKTGHTDLRRVLFMPALATYGRHRAYAPFIDRLKASGKAPMPIIVALMRKILTIAQAVLKSQQPFNAELHMH
jgi:transposase